MFFLPSSLSLYVRLCPLLIVCVCVSTTRVRTSTLAHSHLSYSLNASILYLCSRQLPKLLTLARAGQSMPLFVRTPLSLSHSLLHCQALRIFSTEVFTDLCIYAYTVLFYVVGYIVIASANVVETIAGGLIIYAVYVLCSCFPRIRFACLSSFSFIPAISRPSIWYPKSPLPLSFLSLACSFQHVSLLCYPKGLTHDFFTAATRPSTPHVDHHRR